MAERVRIEVCGRLCVEVDDQERTDALPGRQGRLVLIYLALHRDRPVSRDELTDAVWGEHPPRTAGGSLNALLSKLRAALGHGVVEGSACLQLTDRASVDLDDARHALGQARVRLSEGDFGRAREMAEQAARIAVRGVAVDHEAEWLEDERREVEELRLKALECAGEAGLAIGGTALGDAQRVAATLIAVSGFRESGYVLKMRALAAEGNVAEAMRVYHALRRKLDDELGMLPSPRVQQLADALLTGSEPSVEPGAGAHVDGRRAQPGAGTTPRFATRTHARFVGREDELGRLRAILRQARAGCAQMVLIEGEAGIGKTRLVEQFATSCLREGLTVLAGRCDADAVVPYQPFIQALRPQVATLAPADLRKRLGIHVDELASVLPELAAERAADEPGGGSGDRYRLFEAVSALVTEMARAASTVLILDDLHWADKPTLLMLRHIVRNADDAALMIVGIYRAAEPAIDLYATLADLRREHFFETVRLAGLNELEASELIAALGHRRAPDGFERDLWRETLGNPFFLEEIVRHLATGEGDIRAIPEGVRTVIRHRLAQRSHDANRMLAVAAVTGSEFSIELLERVSDLTELSGDRLYDAIDETVEAQLVTEDPKRYGVFAFSHSLVRQAICSELTLARQGRLHLHIGEALEALGSEHGASELAELARHYLAAPPDRAAERAIRYATEAGGQAMRMLAFEEAERLYTLALRALERHDPSNHGCLGLLLALGDVQVKLGASDAARATFTRALALARESGDTEAFALAALGLGARSLMAGGVVDRDLTAVLEDALGRLPNAESPLAARLLARLADELSFSDRRDECAELTERAVAVARRANDPRAYAFALTSRHWCLWDPENHDERLAAARELLALGERTGQKAIVVEGHRWCMLDLLERGDIAAVDAEIDAYAELARERRVASEWWYVPLFRAMRMLLSGRLDDAEDASLDAIRLGRRIKPANAEQAHTLQMVALRHEQGRLAEMEGAVREMASRYPAIPGWRCVLTYLYAETGRAERARTELASLAERGFRDIPHDGIWLGAMAYLADACVSIGAGAYAAKLYELIEPYAERNISIGWASTCAGSAARHLGALAAMLGRHELAGAHFEHAIAMNRAMGAEPWLLRTQLQYARTLLSSPQRADRRRAMTMLKDARGRAHELELMQLAETATKLLTADGRAATSRARPGSGVTTGLVS